MTPKTATRLRLAASGSSQFPFARSQSLHWTTPSRMSVVGSFVLIFRFKQGMLRTLAAAMAAGLFYHLVLLA